MSKNNPNRRDFQSDKMIRKPKSDDNELTSFSYPLEIRQIEKTSKKPYTSRDFMKKNAADYAPDLLWEFFSDDQPTKNK